VEALLRERGVEFDAVEYLKQPIGRAGLERILDAIADPPADLVRKDKRFAELGLNAADYVTRDTVVDLLLRHPELMQRPVVFRGRRALIARPAEKVLELLD
jgi:arsenate reductase